MVEGANITPGLLAKFTNTTLPFESYWNAVTLPKSKVTESALAVALKNRTKSRMVKQDLNMFPPS
jgi:hypothetical protein